MKISRFIVGISVINLILLAFLLAEMVPARAQGIPDVIRARSLELVDAQGHVRAEIKVFPRDPNVHMPDGTTGYPETVLFRLLSSKGRPNVKIAATEDGSAVVFGGDSDPTLIQLLARGSTTALKLVNKDGKEQVIKP
jgi:hypothetical protein